MSSPAHRPGLRERVAAAIVDAAAGVFAERGNASMSEVASAAGVARGTVYRYFQGREALLEALGGVALDRAAEGLESARVEEVAVGEAFPRAVRALVLVGDYFVVLARERASVDRGEFERRVTGVLRALLERGRAQGEIRGDVPVGWLVEALMGVIVSVLGAGSAAGVEDKVDAITSLFLEGARGGSA